MTRNRAGPYIQLFDSNRCVLALPSEARGRRGETGRRNSAPDSAADRRTEERAQGAEGQPSTKRRNLEDQILRGFVLERGLKRKESRLQNSAEQRKR